MIELYFGQDYEFSWNGETYLVDVGALVSSSSNNLINDGEWLAKIALPHPRTEVLGLPIQELSRRIPSPRKIRVCGAPRLACDLIETWQLRFGTAALARAKGKE